MKAFWVAAVTGIVMALCLMVHLASSDMAMWDFITDGEVGPALLVALILALAVLSLAAASIVVGIREEARALGIGFGTAHIVLLVVAVTFYCEITSALGRDSTCIDWKYDKDEMSVWTRGLVGPPMRIEFDAIEESTGESVGVEGIELLAGKCLDPWDDRCTIPVDDDGNMDVSFWAEGYKDGIGPCFPTRYDLVGHKSQIGSHYIDIVLTCDEELEVPDEALGKDAYTIDVKVVENGTYIDLDKPLSTTVRVTVDTGAVNLWFEEPGSLAPLEPIYEEWDEDEEEDPIVEAGPIYYYHETLDSPVAEQKVIWRIIVRDSHIDSPELVKGIYKGTTRIFVPSEGSTDDEEY